MPPTNDWIQPPAGLLRQGGTYRTVSRPACTGKESRRPLVPQAEGAGFAQLERAFQCHRIAVAAGCSWRALDLALLISASSTRAKRFSSICFGGPLNGTRPMDSWWNPLPQR